MVYLVVHNGVCVNRINYDGGDWSPPPGTTIEPEGETPVDIGWIKVDNQWMPQELDIDKNIETL